ncbi:hypothetical protein BDZ45DRAFT_741347 [Acephala macrosclerotiorum]|nr:hypothetical protein BDZ45DRAFT_741347 [Acephala macrosclerotiorum]
MPTLLSSEISMYTLKQFGPEQTYLAPTRSEYTPSYHVLIAISSDSNSLSSIDLRGLSLPNDSSNSTKVLVETPANRDPLDGRRAGPCKDNLQIGELAELEQSFRAWVVIPKTFMFKLTKGRQDSRKPITYMPWQYRGLDAQWYSTVNMGCTVSVNKGLIQNIHSDLPVFKPGPAITLPPTLLQSTLKSVSPGSQLQSAASGIIAQNGSQLDDAGRTASANNLWTSLNTWNGKFAQFINWQYYFAYPYLFTTSKQTCINSAHVSLTEVHGSWDLFTTYQNWGDVVYLGQIAAGGYGGGAMGKLAYWIIHACEAIPSVIDYPSSPSTSYNIWWHSFGGLRAVVGYRTKMYINDDNHWYGSSSPYVQTYYDANKGINEPYGRASTVYVCGHAGHLVWNVANLGRATCLQETHYQN